MTQYREYGRIAPIIAGELTCTDQFGHRMTPRIIRFNPDGTASAVCYHYIYGNYHAPVFKANGERLRYDGFAGLICDYNEQTGTLENFKED